MNPPNPNPPPAGTPPPPANQPPPQNPPPQNQQRRGWKWWLKWSLIILGSLVLLVVIVPLLFGLAMRLYSIMAPAPAITSQEVMRFGVPVPNSTNHTQPPTQAEAAEVGKSRNYVLVELNSPADTKVYPIPPRGLKQFVAANPAIQFYAGLNRRLTFNSPGTDIAPGNSTTNTTLYVENTNSTWQEIRIFVVPR